MFKFTIRELLLLVVIVALGIGWRLDHQSAADRYAKRSAFIHRLKDRLRWELGFRNAVSAHGLDVSFSRAVLPPELEDETREYDGGRGASMFKFTIRDLLWLTVVVALGIARSIDRSRVDARYQRVRSAYRELIAWMTGGEWVRLGGGKSGDIPAFLPDP